MTDVASITGHALETIRLEAEAVAGLKKYINDSFIKAVEAIFNATGRVVITGIGKSAIIAQKMAATFNSTGTPALFMHAADAIHGDLGMIQPGDITIIISKSGTSPEIKALLPLIKNFGNTVIALCGNDQSYLAMNADLLIDTTVDKEACPHNLAPTTSTTAQLAMGDAVAMCLLHMRGFTEEDFARYHPGGALGKRLHLRVADLSEHNALPAVPPGASLKAVIMEISRNRLGATAVVHPDGRLAGVITDGDLRRLLEKHDDPFKATAADILTRAPKTIEATELATEAFRLMKQHDISQLLVLKNGAYNGILHLHDLIREGIM